MDTRTTLTLIFTFIVGCFSGVYLYVTVFAPQYVGDGFEDPSEITFKLQGQTYGGCSLANTCASFVLNNNRSYEYVVGANQDDAVQGKMNRDDFGDLIDLLLETDFASLQRTEGNDCVSRVDGIDYSYNVILQGEIYPLDTCATTFKGSTLDLELRGLWNDLSVEQERDLPYILEHGMTGAAQQAIDNWFQYDEKREKRERGEIE